MKVSVRPIGKGIWILTAAALLSLFVGRADAQSVSIEDPPPKIAFDSWTEAESDAASQHFTVQFPSADTTAYPANNIVYLDAYLPTKRTDPVPAVLILHYWGATDLRVETNLARRLNRHGIAGIVLTLPYHLKRTPPGSRTGDLAISADPQNLIGTMHQSIQDVRRTVDWIQSRPELQQAPIGITGTSLGSLVSELAVGVESRITHAAFMLGGADLAHIIWHSSRVVKQRDEMRRNGITEERLRQILKPIEPLQYFSKAKLDATFVVAAKFDTVVPPEDASKLIAGLKTPKVLWLDTGHYGGFLVQKQVQGAVASFFASEFAGAAYSPPTHVSAPIVRFGMQESSETQLQVVVGVDVWRWNARGDAFASFLATARGPQLYFGLAASKGLSLGASFSSRRAAPSLLWSLVL